jgi:ParB family chromosome partitioning protein
MDKGNNATAKAPADAGLDLTALEGFDTLSFGDLSQPAPAPTAAPAPAPAPEGQLSLAKISDIEEDPDQPREEFDLTEMRASIRANLAAGRPPIKTPISVKRHPTKPGKWLLNDGARRYRSCVAEGVPEIPYFVDEDHDAFDQLAVNIQREGHTPIEIAKFIQRQQGKGFKNGEIAKRLAKKDAWISKHAALINLPASIQAAYDGGRCRDVEALYMLVRARKDHPEAVDRLCSGDEPISKYVVQALLEQIKAPKAPAPEVARPEVHQPELPAPTGKNSEGQDLIADSGIANVDDSSRQDEGPTPPGNSPDRAEAKQPAASSAAQPDVKEEKSGETKIRGDHNHVRNPVVQVMHSGRIARLLLERKTKHGFAWLQYGDDAEIVEVELASVTLVAVVGS